MCCQQMTPLDLPVLLLHQCQNKSLHQLGSLGALHLRARTSFFGRCLWSANHVVWAAVKPACMEAPCPCISVLCPCHMPLHLYAPCPSIPRSLCPCPTARLGFQGSRRSWAPPGGRPRPRSLGEVRQGPPTGLVLGWLRGLNPACLLWDDWLRCRVHNLEQPWVFPKPRYLFDPTPCSQQLRLCFWRLWFSRVAQAGSSSGHGAPGSPHW